MQQEIKIGSEEHKELFCQVFIDTHVPYDPTTIRWPELDGESLERLRSLPFWEKAVSTEHTTARKVQAFASTETDPLLREAIALDGYEEGRHTTLLKDMTRHYRNPSFRKTSSGPCCVCGKTSGGSAFMTDVCFGPNSYQPSPKRCAGCCASKRRKRRRR